MNKLISVIVPIYNVCEYLDACIRTICEQSYKKLEIILVDDGSTDESGRICNEYASKDARIKVIHKENEGLVRARKTGLMNSTGEYIAYVDGDDWIEPDMIGKLYSTLVKQNVDIAMCGRYEDTGKSTRCVYHGIGEGRYNKQALLNEVYPKMIVNNKFFEWGIFPGVWDKIFKRECLETYQMDVADGLTMGEDAACTYPALLNANSIYVLHECLYHYRQTLNSMVKQNYDANFQRQRFSLLYTSVLNSLERYTDIYDLREQWRDYVLFLIIPRAHMIYRDFDKLDYLFPFKNVKKGSKIILYGMGVYGQLLYGYLKETAFCEVITTVDRNYKEISKQGFSVISPECIKNYEYDAIVVTNTYAEPRKEIYDYLVKLYPAEKINLIDEKLIKSEESQMALGLLKKNEE